MLVGSCNISEISLFTKAWNTGNLESWLRIHEALCS
uniref:Uncharacterized protein n=1 Tax=Arundo donax TaxID=35708 RepID=A0A0A8ZSW5_ARUDO